MVHIDIDSYRNRFVAGFCNAGTPFSTKMLRPEVQMLNPLKKKATILLNDEDMNFWDDGWMESLAFFGGGLLGIGMIPVDVLMTGVVGVTHVFSEEE
ncbi:MAG: hypothetical protein ACI83O_000860 [Patescibacteria group bacterium]|jgi:hypothetical protein